MAALPTAPQVTEARTPASSLTAGGMMDGWMEGQPCHPHLSSPTPGSRRAGPQEPVAPSSSGVSHTPWKQVSPATVTPRSFPKGCLGQKPRKRAASLCRPPGLALLQPVGLQCSCPWNSPSPALSWCLKDPHLPLPQSREALVKHR